MRLEFPGEPIAKSRHRHGTTSSGKKISYDIQKKAKEVVKWLALKQLHDSTNEFGTFIPSKSAFEVILEFHLITPDFKKPNVHAVCKPDIDNLVKFYLDALNRIVWEDDKQIISLHASKTYSDSPKTVITIHPLGTLK